MALRLDRKPGQSVTIPGRTREDDVVVIVHAVEVDGDRSPRVRLEFKAHPDQGIYRTELWRFMQAQAGGRPATE